MRQQKGYVFHKSGSWFLRYMDDVRLPDGATARKLVCKKLPVPYGGQFRKRKDVEPFVREILDPLNQGLFSPQSAMSVFDFVETTYFAQYVANLRPATKKGYNAIWRLYLRDRREVRKLPLRDFRTIHAQTIMNEIGRQGGLSKNSLKHVKSFLSGIFSEAKRLGVLDGFNPVEGVKLPPAPDAPDTHAYSLKEVLSMARVLTEPARTVVMCAALTGLRKGEIRGLVWDGFDGKELAVKYSVWNSIVGVPKTKSSRASIPVIRQLSEALEAHRQRMGKLACGPIFQSSTGSPLNLENLANRIIIPALSRCVVCGKQEDQHKPEGHVFQRDETLPTWHGWHGFRRGIATLLHQLGVDDKTISRILRHSNVSLTQNIYIKSVSESQVSAMDALAEKFGDKFETCTELATPTSGSVN